eukprot:1188299-Rhodomonas_salina.2
MSVPHIARRYAMSVPHTNYQVCTVPSYAMSVPHIASAAKSNTGTRSPGTLCSENGIDFAQYPSCSSDAKRAVVAEPALPWRWSHTISQYRTSRSTRVAP